jgi:hypothetical protein
VRLLPAPPELATTIDSAIGLQLKRETVKTIAPMVIHPWLDSSIFDRIPPSQKSPDKARYARTFSSVAAPR